MSPLTPTASQTIGPFFHRALPFDGDSELVDASHADAVMFLGTVYDGAGRGVSDALIEIRQADPTGVVPRVQGSLRRQAQTFTGWGRCPTDDEGRFCFRTLEPGRIPGSGRPFIAVSVLARGLLNRLFTRAYLPLGGPDEPSDNFLDTLGPAERDGLLARRAPDGSLRFDIHLQGESETTFLRYPMRVA